MYYVLLAAVFVLLGLAIYFSSAQRTVRYLKRLVQLAEEEREDRKAIRTLLAESEVGKPHADLVPPAAAAVRSPPAKQPVDDRQFEAAIAADLKKGLR